MVQRSTKKILQQHKLAPHKRFGQNFLVNPKTAQSIVDCSKVTKDTHVMEVGVGLGALTLPLAKAAKHVLGVEIDSGLIRYHQEAQELPANVTLLHNDILKVDFKEMEKQCGGKLVIVANLPYSISNPFIFKLIENKKHVDRVVVMLQKEVADRLTALPSSKEYGVPTVLLGSCATIQKFITLKPHEFHPQPKIDSLVIGITFSEIPTYSHSLTHCDYQFFQQVVRAAFAKRRKTLVNNLATASHLFESNYQLNDKKLLTEVLEKVGLLPTARAETLSIDEFLKLTNALAEIKTIQG